MSDGKLTKVSGACCGLAAFAIAVVAGMGAENSGEVILFRALVSMFVCQLVGVGLGMIIERVVSDSVQAHKATRPDPLELGSSAMPAVSSVGVS